MHCTGVAVCDDDGSVIGAVHQGQAIHILSEFEIDADIGLPSGWFALSDASGQLMYGTNSFRDGVTTREPPEHGTRLRCRFVVELDLAPGQYFLTVGLLSATAPEYLGYWQAPDDGTRWPEADGTEERAERYRHVGLTEEQFQDRLLQHSRVEHPHPIAVGFDKSGRQTHVGLVALRSRSGLELEPARGSSVADAEATGLPTVVHVTHHKAGSQWIYAILRALVPDRIVPPDARSGHFRYWPPEPGKVYPTVYLTRQQFDLVGVPDDCRRFVMIRDLRDTLVSSYFSLAATHGTPDRQSLDVRRLLRTLSVESGLLYLLDEWLAFPAQIQLSWLESGEPLLRYEDVLARDVESLEAVLLDRCNLGVPRDEFRRVVVAHRFEAMAGGRSRGAEDQGAHLRKGIAGDWQNHFTDRVTRAFKARFGGLLVATGYETDLNW